MDFNEAIERIKQKDDEAFEYIYNETKSSVYAIIITVVKNQDVAEELMQDTYIQMIKSINSYNPKYKFKNWLLTIARNKAIDSYRSRKKEMLIDIHESEYLLPHTKSTADNEYDANFLLSLLSEEEKEVVVLYAIDDYNHREIAEILDKPIGTVTWIYSKAIKKMKKAGKGITLWKKKTY